MNRLTTILVVVFLAQFLLSCSGGGQTTLTSKPAGLVEAPELTEDGLSLSALSEEAAALELSTQVAEPGHVVVEHDAGITAVNLLGRISYDAAAVQVSKWSWSPALAGENESIRLVVDDQKGELQFGICGLNGHALEYDAGELLSFELEPAGPAVRTASTLGNPLRNKVSDLEVVFVHKYGASSNSVDLDRIDLTWSYNQISDGDRNTEVSIVDLTKIGMYFQQRTTMETAFGPAKIGDEDDPLYASYLTQVDGDRNGVINISDLTPLGSYLGWAFSNYQVYYKRGSATATPLTTWKGRAGEEIEQSSATVKVQQGNETHWKYDFTRSIYSNMEDETNGMDFDDLTSFSGDQTFFLRANYTSPSVHYVDSLHRKFAYDDSAEESAAAVTLFDPLIPNDKPKAGCVTAVHVEDEVWAVNQSPDASGRLSCVRFDDSAGSLDASYLGRLSLSSGFNSLVEGGDFGGDSGTNPLPAPRNVAGIMLTQNSQTHVYDQAWLLLGRIAHHSTSGVLTILDKTSPRALPFYPGTMKAVDLDDDGCDELILASSPDLGEGEMAAIVRFNETSGVYDLEYFRTGESMESLSITDIDGSGEADDMLWCGDSGRWGMISYAEEEGSPQLLDLPEFGLGANYTSFSAANSNIWNFSRRKKGFAAAGRLNGDTAADLVFGVDSLPVFMVVKQVGAQDFFNGSTYVPNYHLDIYRNFYKSNGQKQEFLVNEVEFADLKGDGSANDLVYRLSDGVGWRFSEGTIADWNVYDENEVITMVDRVSTFGPVYIMEGFTPADMEICQLNDSGYGMDILLSGYSVENPEHARMLTIEFE